MTPSNFSKQVSGSTFNYSLPYFHSPISTVSTFFLCLRAFAFATSPPGMRSISSHCWALLFQVLINCFFLREAFSRTPPKVRIQWCSIHITLFYSFHLISVEPQEVTFLWLFRNDLLFSLVLPKIFSFVKSRELVCHISCSQSHKLCLIHNTSLACVP